MDKPIRVLHVVTKMYRAGAETMLMHYYRHIDRSRVQFDFLAHRAEIGDFEEEIRSLGGNVYRTYPISPRTFPAYRRDLNRFFASHAPTYRIVHAHLDALSAFPLAAAKKAGVPVRIAHAHINQFDKDWKLPLRKVSRVMVPGVATDFFGCTPDALRFMFGETLAQSAQAHILVNAIDALPFDFCTQTRESTRNALKVENSFVVGHVGRFMSPKNHAYLIEIFDALQRQRPESLLLLIGQGEREAEIRRLVAQKGLNQKVRFMGVREDIPVLMQAMDAFILPSHYEGLGIVLIEAQAAGLCCFASADVVPGEAKITDLLEYIPLRNTPDMWARQILARASAYERRSTLAQITAAGYSIHEQAKNLEAFYLDAYSRK